MSDAEMVQPTSDERVMAALSHFFGFIAAIIVWATQKDKSRFVRFQSLQAMAFDAVCTVGYLALMMCMMGVMFIGLMGVMFSAAQSSASPDSFLPIVIGSMLFPFGMFFFVVPISLAVLLVRTIAAVSVASGHNFRYPLIADRLDAFLAASPAPGNQSTGPATG